MGSREPFGDSEIAFKKRQILPNLSLKSQLTGMCLSMIDFHFFLKNRDFLRICKNPKFSNWPFSASFYRKHFRVGAFESPEPTLGIFATYEHLRASASICMVSWFCAFLFIFRAYRGLRRFTGGLLRFMQKLLVFPDQIGQGLSNAPTLKCFR